MIPFHFPDGHQASAVAVAIQNGNTFRIIVQNHQGMAASGTDQCAGFRTDTPGNEILVCKIIVVRTGQIQLLGIFTGGLKAASGGITAAIFFGLLISFLFKPKDKS